MKTFKDFVSESVETLVDEEILNEKNIPTSPEKWAQAKSAAKSKFAVYPSAYANAWASKKYKSMGGGWKSANEETEIDENHLDIAMGKVMDDEGSMILNQLDHMERSIALLRTVVKDPEMQIPAWVQSKVTLASDYMDSVSGYMSSKNEEVEIDESAAWQRKEGKNPEGGLNRKGIASYRRENPGSKLSMAVTTPPSKLDPDSKAAKRRKSFCARMSGMPGPMKDEKGRPTRKALSLKKWNC